VFQTAVAGRDGFTAQEFHLRCDGCANTLTLISDTDGNVFSGFTPVEWESGNEWKGDNSLWSFLFMLKNPHCVPPRKFALKAEKKQNSIECYSGDCAVFGDSNANRNNFTRIGTRSSSSTYANDTDFEDFFTDAEKCTMKETQFFKIADYTTLPADVEKCVNGHLFQERNTKTGRPREVMSATTLGTTISHKNAVLYVVPFGTSTKL
jgi:hypothetical protein